MDIGKLADMVEVFEGLEDWRNAQQTRRRLSEVLTVAVCAVLSGADCRRNRHAQARLPGDEGADLRVMAMLAFEGLDVLGQAEHALHHGFEARCAFGVGSTVDHQCGFCSLRLEVHLQARWTAVPDQALAQGRVTRRLGDCMRVASVEGENVAGSVGGRQRNGAGKHRVDRGLPPGCEARRAGRQSLHDHPVQPATFARAACSFR